MNDIDRSTLPIPDPASEPSTILDANDPAATFPPIEPLRAPTGAPNALIVLLDDVRFAASSAFGGRCHTQTAEHLAAGGLKYNRKQAFEALASPCASPER